LQTILQITGREITVYGTAGDADVISDTIEKEY